MKIEDKIYIPHVCSECNKVRLIPRDDLHDKPEIVCSTCSGLMKRWVVHKEEKRGCFSGECGYYLTYTPKLRETTGTPWQQNSGSSLADVRKKVGQDLVDYPGLPEMVYLPSEYEAAQLRVEMMQEKIEDIVVTLVIKARFVDPVGTIRVESLRYSQLAGRIDELKRLAKEGGGIVFVVTAYSEETGQEFWWNNMELQNEPRLPGYSQEYDKKRKTYRNTTDGVL